MAFDFQAPWQKAMHQGRPPPFLSQWTWEVLAMIWRAAQRLTFWDYPDPSYPQSWLWVPIFPFLCLKSRHMCISVCVVCVLWVCVFTFIHVCRCGCVWCCSFSVSCTNVHIMHENYLTLLCPAVCRLLSLTVDTISCLVFYLYMFCACHYLSINLNSRIQIRMSQSHLTVGTIH